MPTVFLNMSMKLVVLLCVFSATAAFVPPPDPDINVHQLPSLLGGSNEKGSENEIDPNILEEVKDILTITKNIDYQAKLIARKLQNERSRADKLLTENADLKTKTEDLKCGLSIVKLRTGWEEFEAEFGSDVHITMYSNETVKKIGWKERNRRKRERKCLLIFEEMKHEERVKRLIEEIEKSDPGPLALKKFAYAISWAFQYLCDSVHVYLEHQVRGAPNLHDLTDDRIAYYALQIFVKYKYVELPSQLQECVSENHTTKAP